MSRLSLQVPSPLLQRVLALLLCLFLVDPGLAGVDDDGDYAKGFSQTSLLDPGLFLETDGVEGDDHKDLLGATAMPARPSAAACPTSPGEGARQTSFRLRAHPPRAPPLA